MNTHRIRAFAFTPGAPPAELRLWRTGDNPTDYGVHRWTQRSIKLVGDEYARRGNPLPIDVEHGAPFATPGQAYPTGGYARLELRNGEPWLVFDWSAFAVDQIASRQRLFLSPEYLTDKTTGEIVGLIRVSLVSDPGTHHATQLASAPRVRTVATSRTTHSAIEKAMTNLRGQRAGRPQITHRGTTVIYGTEKAQ